MKCSHEPKDRPRLRFVQCSACEQRLAESDVGVQDERRSLDELQVAAEA